MANLIKDMFTNSKVQGHKLLNGSMGKIHKTGFGSNVNKIHKSFKSK